MFQTLAAAAVFGLSGGLSPGPLLALVVAQALAHGRSAGLAVAAAPLLTDAPIIVAAVFLHGRIEDSGPALGLISLAGGALLATWGIAGLRSGPPDTESDPVSASAWGSLWKGVAVNTLNPSPYLFWLTIGAPMVVQAWEWRWPGVAAYLLIFYLGLVGSKAVLAVLVARSRKVLGGAGYLWANRAVSLVLLVYAVIFIRAGIESLAGG